MTGYSPINLGNIPNDEKGDPLRIGGQKINTMFQELYSITAGITESLADYATTTAMNAAIGAAVGSLAMSISSVGYSGAYDDLSGKPSLSAVALSGAYGDLTGTPVIGADVQAWSNNLDAWSVIDTASKQAVLGYTPVNRAGDTITGQLTIAQGAIAASAPFTITQTWSGTGVYTGLLFNATDSGPSNAASLLADFQVGGASKASISKAGAFTAASVAATGAITANNNALQLNGTQINILSNAATFNMGNAADVSLFRDAADTLAQRRSTNAQAFRLYNTFTDASNYERGFIDWVTNSNILTIGTQNAGTGSARDVRIRAGSQSSTFSSAGLMTIPAALALNNASSIVSSPSAGVVRFTDGAASSFSILQIGLGTSSFPAIKRNGAGLDFRLGDDSGYAPLAALTMNLAGQSLTGSQATNLANWAATWNTTGTPTALLMNVTDTASNAASLLADFQVGGVSKIQFGKDGSIKLPSGIAAYRFNDASSSYISVLSNGVITLAPAAGAYFSIGLNDARVGSNTSIGWSSATTSAGTTDTFLNRDGAANIIAMRNGVNAQAFRVYNTFTDASNYERLDVEWVGNVARIHTTKAGTGSTRNLALISSGPLQLWSADTQRWNIDANGHFVAQTDNTYDIGQFGTTRPRNIFAGGDSYVANGQSFRFESRSRIFADADGLIKLTNNANTDFARLMFGGATSSFPAIKRDGVGLSMRLADDSAGTWFKLLRTTVTSLPSASTSGAGAMAIVSDALTPAIGVAVAGSGAVQVLVISDGTNWIVS